MSQEAHVRFWEGVGVQLLCATQLVVIGARPRHQRERRTRSRRDPERISTEAHNAVRLEDFYTWD